MILDFWDKISYMVQIIMACLIIMIPARKKDYFILRVVACTVVLLCVSYLLNCIRIDEITGAILVAYWSIFPVICILLVWCCLDVSFLEAVYYTICACAMQHIAYDLYLITQMIFGDIYIISLVIYILTYSFYYFFCAKRLPGEGGFVISRELFFPMATIVLIVYILSTIEAFVISTDNAISIQRVFYRIVDFLCCFYVLWMQIIHNEKMRLQMELSGIDYALRQKKDQYEVTTETIDIINRKCHDLKHQIHVLRNVTDQQEKEAFFSEIEDAIMIYDTALQTGNKALDTVLMEKGLFCKNHNIQWTCMADGTKLNFINFADIYAMFGNALDNAITEVMNLEDPEKRVLSLRILIRNKLLVIEIQNYYDKKLHFEEGLPVTTKKNKWYHGFGMKSIQHTAEKYNGTISVRTEDAIFTLQIIIPLPE